MKSEKWKASRFLDDLIEFKKSGRFREGNARLKSGIAGSKQFYHKVDLNLKLKARENQLKSLLSKN